MKKTLALLLAALIAALTLVSAGAEALETVKTMYVKTNTGIDLRVREEPNANSAILGTVRYGRPVSVIRVLSSGWSEVVWEADGKIQSGYMSSRYLSETKPESKPSTEPSATPAPSQDKNAEAANALDAMNSEFRSAHQVNPFVAVVLPARTSGWVNLRWAPSTSAERITTYAAGKELIVHAELKNWYLVQDPESLKIGFISRKYVQPK